MSRPIVAWSFSALSDFINCPFKYWAVRVGKIVSDVNAANSQGEDYHRDFEMYVSKGMRLKPELVRFQPVLDKLKHAPGQIVTEGQYALDQNYNPCGFKDWDNAWVRAVTDVSILNGIKCSTVDYKFGKPRKDPDQNALVAGVLMQTYPQLQEVNTAYWYVMHDKVVRDRYTRDDIPAIWNRFLPNVNKLAQAKTRDEWPKQPNPLCGWCPVHSCQHNTNPKFQSQSPT
jgi:hypothetical protein